MADALQVLLLTWNQAFFRFGMFNPSRLENALREHMILIDAFQLRDIKSFVKEDEPSVRRLFMALLSSLRVRNRGNGKTKPRRRYKRSPVGVVKTMHLLAPAFFPLWDDKIARAYKCQHTAKPVEEYFRFMKISQTVVAAMPDDFDTGGRTPLKIFDEFNYAKYTLGIRRLGRSFLP